MPDQVKTIFFGLYQTLGDIVTSTALIHTIKEKYPDYKLTYCTAKEYTDVFHNNPDVNEIIPANSVGEVILRSVEKHYDKVFLPLQLTSEHNRWHQSKRYCVPKEGEFHNLVDYYADRCFDDLKITDRRTFMFPDESHWEEIVNNIPEAHREHFVNTPFVTLHTTSRNPSKDWPYANFNELGKRIKEKYGDKLEVYQIGGADDKALVKPIFPLMGTPILNTTALLKRSLLHVDGDSGPSHLATSVGTKTICIMGATTSENGTHGPIFNAEFIEPTRKCLDQIHTPCATRCLVNSPCIDEISVDTVFNKVCQEIDKKLGIQND